MARPKFKCVFCDGEASIEAYEGDTPEQLAGTIVNIKMCNPHAERLEEIRLKKEVQRTVA